MTLPTSLTPNLRQALNTGVLQQRVDEDRQIVFGDLLGLLIQGITPTEAAAAVASNQKTLTHAASSLLDVVVTAGGLTGRKTLLRNSIQANFPAGQGTTPAIPSGFVAWDGASLVGFSPADAVTASNFTYTRQDAVNVLTSSLERLLGQRD